MSEIHSSELQQTIAKGLPASAGIATGLLVLDREEVLQFSENGEDVVYVRAQTVLDDVPAMQSSTGVITGTGGLTSHAAIVSRDLKKPCIVGCTDLRIKPDGVEFISGPTVTFIQKGSRLSINGSTGEILHSASVD